MVDIEVAAQRHRLAAVAQQTLIDRAPPRTSGPRAIKWLEHAASQLPTHKRHRRPSIRQMPRSLTERPVIGAVDERDPRRRMITYGGDLFVGPCRGGHPSLHAAIISRRQRPNACSRLGTGLA
jgi:hypothetical protein